MSLAHFFQTRLSVIIGGLALALVIGGSGCANKPKSEASAAMGADAAIGAVEVGPAIGESTDGTVRLTVVCERWQFAEHEGLHIATPNYHLYTTVQSEEFLENLPIFYERALEHYTTALAPLPKPDEPLQTYLFQNRRQWQAKTAELLPEQAEMFSNLGRGGFTTKGTAVLYYIDRWGYPRDTYAIAAHEGWHQYTQRTFQHQLPIWLEEGVATYMEGYRRGPDELPIFDPLFNGERRWTLRDALRRDELIPIEQLLTRTPQSFLNENKDALLVYYAQVWALTRFLAEGEGGRYRSALGGVLLDAAEGKLVGRMMASKFLPGDRRRGSGGAIAGRVGPAVVREYFNADLAEFERQYLSFLQVVSQRPSQSSADPRQPG